MTDRPAAMGDRNLLLHAYLATTYTVLDDGSAVGVTIGVVSPEIDAVLRRHGAVSGAFVTAWNPRSQVQPRAVNDAAHARLEAELRRRGIVGLPHSGVGADAAWEPEHGVLALDLPLADAVALAQAYGQNAVVVVELGKPARLVLTSLMPGG